MYIVALNENRMPGVLKYFLITVFLFGSSRCWAQPVQQSGDHELTLFVIPSATPLKWESPASLYKSFFKGYLCNFLKKEKYLLGHLFISFSSPLLDSTLLTGMASASKKEKRILYLKDKIGMGILGVAMQGRLDKREDLIKKMEHYSKKNQLAFITYRLTENAARKIIDFYKAFSSVKGSGFSPSTYYGGAFWPRYKNEGAGCTAFGLAMLDLAGQLDEVTDRWNVTVNIPMDIIGGEVNDNLRVKSRTIKKYKDWYEGNGTEEIDYVPFSIYDPSIIFQWIKEQRTSNPDSAPSGFIPSERGRVPGLFTDRTKIEVDPAEPVFLERDKNLFFLKPYLESVNSPETIKTSTIK